MHTYYIYNSDILILYIYVILCILCNTIYMCNSDILYEVSYIYIYINSIIIILADNTDDIHIYISIYR